MSGQNNRLYFLDNLRTFMIFLVVVLHSALVYDSSGFPGFFWIVYDFNTNVFVDELVMFCDIFVMSVIFFISGYLTMPSLNKKSKMAFIKTKAKRLLVPWLFGVLVLIPLYKIIFLFSRGMAQENWTTYFHFNNGIFSQNWLWYLPMLFTFDMIFLALSYVKIDAQKLSLKIVMPAMFVVGFIFSLIMEFKGWQGWTKNAIWNFQNERILIYFMFFLLGALFYVKNIFQQKLANKSYYGISTLFLVVSLGIYRNLYFMFRFSPGEIIYSATIDKVVYWFAFHVTLWSIMFLLFAGFRVLFNSQKKLGKLLNQNSYYVYIVHVIVMGIIGYLLLEVNLPSVLKFIILTSITYLFSNLLVVVYRRVAERVQLLISK